jgi:hypothetical protein
MTTADRVTLDSWTPTVVIPGRETGADSYTGRHRKPGVRAVFGLIRAFYRPRHLSR